MPPGPANVDVDERMTHLREVACSEFGRHGYEATTLRSIAMTAGLGTSTVYRFFPSKEDLLASIIDSYSQKRRSAWNAVLVSRSTAVEKLDALAWLYIVLLERFGSEFRIRLGTVRHARRSIRPRCRRPTTRISMRSFTRGSKPARSGSEEPTPGRMPDACTKRYGRRRTSSVPKDPEPHTRWRVRRCSPERSSGAASSDVTSLLNPRTHLALDRNIRLS